MRPELCAEAMRLGRVLAGLMTREAEAHGLVALMELQASRVGARTDPAGEPVLLADQDRRRWDRLLIRHGLHALVRARSLGGPPGPYEVQAEIAACHAQAHSVQATDWERVAALYVVLGHLTPSPVVELNRAVAAAWRTARPAAWRSRTGWSPTRPWRPTLTCPRCAATCWPNWADWRKPGMSSAGPPRSPATSASGPCSAPAPTPACGLHTVSTPGP
jgi:Predicted RNA polymerase sigma factor containing a TPR repeat domain